MLEREQQGQVPVARVHPAAAAPGAPVPRTWARGMRHAGGFLLLVTGIPLLVSPVPVAPAIFLGLNLLKDDYLWARRLVDRLRTTSEQLRNHFPQSRLQLGQATLRRHLFGRRLWWRKAVVTVAPVPPAASTSNGGSAPAAGPAAAGADEAHLG